MAFIIGLVGENGGGKGTFAEALMAAAKEAGASAERLRSSDILKDTLSLWHIPSTRENLGKLALLMVRVYGEGTLTNAVRNRIEKSAADIVIFDGVRWKSDEALVRSFPKNLMAYVTTDPKLRYERMRARKEKSGEEHMTFEQFLKDEKAPTEKDIPEIGARADIRLENNDSLGLLQEKMKEIWQTRIVPLVKER